MVKVDPRPSPGSPFLVGVNYWPRRKAMNWWRDFDAGEVRDEFDVIRGLGLSLVRIFLLWDDFQPAPDSVSVPALERLRMTADIAAERGLGLDVTFFTGHMSGPNWVPRWLLDSSPPTPGRRLVSGGRVVEGGYRNPYTDPLALGAERILLRAVVEGLRDHPAVALWNLGNEPDLFARPPDSGVGRDWSRAMTGEIRAIDPVRPVTCGLHSGSLESDNGLRVDHVFGETDVAVMHVYPMYVSWARHRLDPEVAVFACALTRALCGRPILLEEFGGCTAPPGKKAVELEWEALGRPHRAFLAAEEDLAEHLDTVLPRLVSSGVTGALLWCFSDYAPDVWDRPPCDEYPHERHFGLLRPDGGLKPHAEIVRRFAASGPKVATPAPPLFPPPLSPDRFYLNPGEHLAGLYRMHLAARPRPSKKTSLPGTVFS